MLVADFEIAQTKKVLKKAFFKATTFQIFIYGSISIIE